MNFMCTNLKQVGHKRPKSPCPARYTRAGRFRNKPKKKNQFENFSVHLSGGRVFLSPLPGARFIL